MTSIHTWSGLGTRKPAVFSSLLRSRWIDSVLTESDSAGLNKGVASRWWGENWWKTGVFWKVRGIKLEIQHWIWFLLAIFYGFYHGKSPCFTFFVQPPNKQIQVTFMNFIGEMSFLCPKNPWDDRFAVLPPLFGVSWQEGLVFFHRRGQDSFPWNTLNIVMGYAFKYCNYADQVCWRPLKALLGCSWKWS